MKRPLRSRTTALALAALWATGCGPSQLDLSADDDGPWEGLAEDAEAALGRLPKATIDELGPDGVPVFIRGNLGRLASRRGDRADVDAALSQLASVFRVRAEELELASLETDALGTTRYAFVLREDAETVEGGGLQLYANRLGLIYAAQATVRSRVGAAPTARVSGAQAQAAALRAVAATGMSATAEGLTWRASSSGPARRVWSVRVQGRHATGEVEERVYVDAVGGQVVGRVSLRHQALARTIFDAEETWSLPGTRARSETTGPSGQPDVDRNFDRLGEAHACLQTLFGRDSYDGRGALLNSSVRYGSGPAAANAYWYPSERRLVFGTSVPGYFHPAGDSLDIVAHELMHGVTQFSANLEYANEPGALNESTSDVLAALCQALRDGESGPGVWRIGEDWVISDAQVAIRYLDDPALGGSSDHYSNYLRTEWDYGGVHTNSGIPNLAFKLLATGGKHPRIESSEVPGLGLRQAGAIWYRALTRYFSPRTSFRGARAATRQAGIDLYGESAGLAVNAAWDAVGVVPKSTEPLDLLNGSPVTITSGQGTDRFILYVPERANDVKLTFNGGAGNLRVFLRRDAPPTKETHDQTASTPGTSLTLKVPNNPFLEGARSFHLWVTGNYRDVTLTGAYVALEDRTADLGAGPVAVPGGSRNAEVHARVEVPAGTKLLRLRYDGSGSVSLYGRMGAAPHRSGFDARALASTLEVRSPGAGTWYFMLLGMAQHSAGRLQLELVR